MKIAMSSAVEGIIACVVIQIEKIYKLFTFEPVITGIVIPFGVLFCNEGSRNEC